MENAVMLPGLSHLDIREGEHVYHGGSQEWYAEHWQRQAGCGPTNCANILWYLAQTKPGAGALCPYSAGQKSEFLRLMQDVWGFVTPGHMGLNTTELFVNGAKRYGEERGVALAAQALEIPPLQLGARNYDETAAFVEAALQKSLPVAFLNLSNGTLENLDSWHWVTLVALQGDRAMMLDQGEANWIELRQWVSTSIMGGGFAVLEPEGEAQKMK